MQKLFAALLIGPRIGRVSHHTLRRGLWWVPDVQVQLT